MKCRAKNKETCRFHGDPKNNLLANKFTEPYKLLNAGQLSERALADIPTDVTKPLWWSHLYGSKVEAGVLEPKILDVLPSPVGDIAVVWEEQMMTDRALTQLTEKNRKMSVCRYRLMSDGSSVGGVVLNHDDETHLSVNASDVDVQLKGKGYGSALYLYTAKQLATAGKVLTNGRIQSHDAADMWASLQKHHPQNVTKVTVRTGNGRTTTTTLDLNK